MRILVIRLSAMGDVAMVLPVIKGFRSKYPGCEVVLLTRKAFGSFFGNLPGVTIFAPELDTRHKGFIGIFRLFRDLRGTGRFECVIDLHDVLRSKITGLLFRMSGTRVVSIDKGRKEKKELIRGRKKLPLKHTVERYADTFRRAGFDFEPLKGKCFYPGEDARAKAASHLAGTEEVLNVGIAPFAKHALKQWPVEKMIKLMEMIGADRRTHFWLFGGKDECKSLAEIEKSVPGSVSLCGRLTIEEEMAFMERLDFMITMDSSNMHMAALSGARVFSIWGATDPMAGFGAWGQPEEYLFGISHTVLPCRPCTVYGRGRCRRGDFACMEWMTPELVYKKLVELSVIRIS
ncbi:MAG: glycosyltransferase family 9 protein [Bacteroidales bacterium]|nr:glycosyltransferase family 9 protein [Bacteroidales bacterium]